MNVYPAGFISELYRNEDTPQAMDGYMDPADLANQIMFALSAPKSMRVEQMVLNRKK
jgi:NADP-dependent 3-hydroxy acid dehydrogenase YdfG